MPPPPGDAEPPATRIAGALGALLLRGNRARLYDRLVAGVPGVDETTYPVLSGVARLGPVTTTRLAEQIGLDRSVTTRHAGRLRGAGLLARTGDPADGRAALLTLTDAGRAAVATMRSTLTDALTEAMADWRPEDAEALAEHLQRLLSRLLSDRPPEDPPIE